MQPTSVSSGLQYLLLLAALSSCISTSVLPLGEQRGDPRPPGSVVLLFDAPADVGRPYHKLARIHGDASSSASYAELVARMQDDARRVGADALILGRGGKELRGADADGVSWRRSYVAVAIRFVSQSGREVGNGRE